MPIVVVEDRHKRYADNPAARGLSLPIDEGRGVLRRRSQRGWPDDQIRDTDICGPVIAARGGIQHRSVEGPGRFFRAHTGVCVLAVAGAFGTSCYAALEARRPGPRDSRRWWLLAGLTAAQAAGVMVARQRAAIASPGGRPR